MEKKACELSQAENKMIHKIPPEADKNKEKGDKSSELPQEEGKKTVHISRRPWITEEFMQKVRQRDELHSKVKKNPADSAMKKQFRLCRNQTAALRKKLKHAYQMYLEEL
ncbi:uncharacterized protein LOC117640956 [Thrips palmi]|uniref:Uncharacterized protein LOC117640956 n=1 Tax=Thrips palmi TaxID=161013 RepID=A0A6P8ZIN3_THRPL|nr:uncharacterized protein LOC117640956 [Thrips palmi]